MRVVHHHSRPRGAFTLVELLVVITIIGILVALTSAAVVRALVKGDEVKQKNEIAQLSTAIQSFKTHYGVSYLPSQFKLKNVYGPTEEAFVYLRSIWPRIGTASGGGFSVTWPGITIPSNGEVIIGSSECLVLFLGGTDGVSGFANDPRQPFVTTGAGRSLTPAFFEFAQDRLKVLSGRVVPSYLDVYGTPYAYFSSAVGNDYNAAHEYDVAGNLRPFVNSNGKFINPSTFQIISAGRDQKFGRFNYTTAQPFVIWNGGTFVSTDVETDPKNASFDNVANFHPTQLGIGSN